MSGPYVVMRVPTDSDGGGNGGGSADIGKAIAMVAMVMAKMR